MKTFTKQQLIDATKQYSGGCDGAKASWLKKNFKIEEWNTFTFTVEVTSKLTPGDFSPSAFHRVFAAGIKAEIENGFGWTQERYLDMIFKTSGNGDTSTLNVNPRTGE